MVKNSELFDSSKLFMMYAMKTEGNAETRLAPYCKVSHTAIIWPAEAFIDNREKINSYNLKVLNLHKNFGPPYRKGIEIRNGGKVLYV